MTVSSDKRRHWQLATVALIASLLGCELAFRIFLADHRIASARVWMLSSPYFQLGPLGGVRYFPNQQMRALAVWNGAIEWDVRYRTNDLGFIDDEDYGDGMPEDSRAYAFVGDSFTAGMHGGKPWVADLRHRMRRTGSAPLQIYNLGIEGTGFHHFAKILAEVHQQLRIDEVFILAISDDLRRTYWIPETSPEGIRFCEPARLEQCRAQEPMAHVFDEGASEMEVLARAQAVVAARETPPGMLARLRVIAGRSALMREVQAAWRVLKSRNERPNAMTMLSIARSLGGTPVHLVHLPEKEEVGIGRYHLDLEPLAKSAGIDYVAVLDRCPWDLDMFFPHDGHPNARGYRAIGSCIERLIDRGWTTGGTN